MNYAKNLAATLLLAALPTTLVGVASAQASPVTTAATFCVSAPSLTTLATPTLAPTTKSPTQITRTLAQLPPLSKDLASLAAASPSSTLAQDFQHSASGLSTVANYLNAALGVLSELRTHAVTAPAGTKELRADLTKADDQAAKNNAYLANASSLLIPTCVSAQEARNTATLLAENSQALARNLSTSGLVTKDLLLQAIHETAATSYVSSAPKSGTALTSAVIGVTLHNSQYRFCLSFPPTPTKIITVTAC